MNMEQFEGKWEQVKGLAKEKWGKLTDDDLMEISGKAEQLKGKLRERYGYTKEEVESEVHGFCSDLDEDSCCGSSKSKSC